MPRCGRRSTTTSFSGSRSRTRLAGFLMTPDAAFGHDRRGTPETVAALGARDGFDVVVGAALHDRRTPGAELRHPGGDRRRRSRRRRSGCSAGRTRDRRPVDDGRRSLGSRCRSRCRRVGRIDVLSRPSRGRRPTSRRLGSRSRRTGRRLDPAPSSAGQRSRSRSADGRRSARRPRLPVRGHPATIRRSLKKGQVTEIVSEDRVPLAREAEAGDHHRVCHQGR